jgi:hypothetical protein
MNAKFPGTCILCGGQIIPGEEIGDSGLRGPMGGKKMAHVRCLTGVRLNPAVRVEVPVAWTRGAFNNPMNNGLANPRDLRTPATYIPYQPGLGGQGAPFAHWTSFPEYSYTTFARDNGKRRAQRNPELARAVYLPMPENAGPYWPEMFPYGAFGRPAEYTTDPEPPKKNPASRPVEGSIRGSSNAELARDIAFFGKKLKEAKAARDPWGIEWAQDRLAVAKDELRKRKKSGAWKEPRKARPNRGQRSGPFLKPPDGWPVGDPEHIGYALQYMTAGRGRPSEYPTLIRRLAKLYSPEDERNSWIWTRYRQYKPKIEAMTGYRMPDMMELRRLVA